MVIYDRQLSPHFKLSEFLVAEEPEPPAWVINNLTKLAQQLETIRTLLDKPIVITSGYRSIVHNRRVGGARQSFHTQGLAVDITVPGMSAHAVQSALKEWPGGLGGYPYHTHVDIRGYKARWGLTVNQSI